MLLTLCYALLRSATLCYALLRSATLCYALLRSATLCYALLRSKNDFFEEFIHLLYQFLKWHTTYTPVLISGFSGFSGFHQFAAFGRFFVVVAGTRNVILAIGIRYVQKI
jgi:hypothetical protein